MPTRVIHTNAQKHCIHAPNHKKFYTTYLPQNCLLFPDMVSVTTACCPGLVTATVIKIIDFYSLLQDSTSKQERFVMSVAYWTISTDNGSHYVTHDPLVNNITLCSLRPITYKLCTIAYRLHTFYTNNRQLHITECHQNSHVL